MRMKWITLLLSLLALPVHAQELRVQVSSTPRRATVEVLGRGEVGRTPIRALRLPAGEYDFIFTLPGYARQVVQVAVTENGQEVGATLERAASLNVRADHIAARGAAIRVDGQQVGSVPGRVEIAPGRRLVEVEAEGYLTFSHWVELPAGATETLNVRLDERPPDTGAILIVTDVRDAEVIVDGERRGPTPRVVEGLAPGSHRVEVVAESGARVESTVEVRAGAREVVSVELASRPPPPGRVSVVTAPPGATVLVDGAPRGETPVVVEGLTPGAHMLDVSLEGFVSQQRVLTVESGVEARLEVTLERGEPRPGRIVVRASHENTFVIVDGLSRGRAPISLEHVRPGRHVVRLVAEGRAASETECVITYGETCTIDGELAPAPVPVRIEASVDGETVPGARLFVDGEEVGAMPWEGELSVGAHELVARAEGLEPASRRLSVDAALVNAVVVLSLAWPEPPAVEPVEEDIEEENDEAPVAMPEAPRAFVPRSGADVLPSGAGTAGFFIGWPHFIGAELAVGLPGAADVGFTLRTFGRLTELEVGGRVGGRVLDFLAIGAELRLSAGLGPDDVNAFGAMLDGRVTAFPIPELAFSVSIGIDLTTDAYPYLERDASRGLVNVGRQDLARARLGGALEWRFLPEWSAELFLEGILASTGGTRRIYGDLLGLGGPDTQLYGELAATYHW